MVRKRKPVQDQVSEGSCRSPRLLIHDREANMDRAAEESVARRIMRFARLVVHAVTSTERVVITTRIVLPPPKFRV